MQNFWPTNGCSELNKIKAKEKETHANKVRWYAGDFEQRLPDVSLIAMWYGWMELCIEIIL